MSTVEEQEGGRAARRWLMREARALRGRALLPIALGAANTLCAIAEAFLIARLLATLLGFAGGGWGDLALAGMLALLMAWLGAAQEQAQVAAGETARARLREAAFARLLAADGQPVGEKAAILVDRIEALDGFFSRWIPAVALALISPALVIFAAGFADWPSALVLLVMGLLVPVAMAMTGIGAALESRRQLDALGRLSGRFVDRLRGLKTLVLFNRQREEAEALGAAAEEFRRRTMKVLRVAFLSTATLEFLAAATLVYLAWRHGALLGATHPNPVLALFCLLLVPVFFAPLRSFSQSYHEAMSARGAAASLVPLLRAEAPGGLLLEEVPPRVAVVLSDVRLTYDASRGEALSGLTFSAAPGETVLLVGASGAGKSSVL
jgi:ATP-binding cassette subfamily C protein CydD